MAAAALKPIVQLRGGSTFDGRMRMMRTLQRRQCVVAAAAAAATDSASALTYERSKNQLAALGSRSDRNWDSGDNGGMNYVTQEKLDQWITDSVGEIVSNIGEAPFLVHIFSHGPLLRLEREEALPEKWQSVQKRWDQGTCPPPDGIILVEELKDEDEEAVENIGTSRSSDHSEASTKKWGLVVQGKGMDRASCYVLNTCRVRSPFGFCTHFCLLRAKCSGEPLETQIRNVWLQCTSA